MIPIQRKALEPDLTVRLGVLTEQIREEKTDPRQKARRLWKLPRPRTELRDVLETMAVGINCCMYCGDSQGTDIDHFEPLSRSPLRTFDWLNHLLACSACNSHQKGSRFPVDSAGKPLLIDPTSEDPFEHLVLSIWQGTYHHRSPKGEATIDALGLNRGVLVMGREHAREVVLMCLESWLAADVRADGPGKQRAIAIIRHQPFADVSHAMLRQATFDGAPTVFATVPWALDVMRQPDFREALN